MTRLRSSHVKPSVPSEKVEQAHVLQLLRSFGGKLWLTGVPRRRGDFQGAMRTPGLPDIIGFMPRTSAFPGMRLLCVECKKRGGKLSPEQETFRELCFDAGVDHVVGGYDDVVAWLIETGYAKPEQFPVHHRPAVFR